VTRLSAWIVNYHSGAFCVRCVESLMEGWREAGGTPDELEVVVVDSGSGEDEARWWSELRKLGVRVVVREQNLGYARGMSVAAAHSFGRADDLIAVLNPDLYFLPGSIEKLCDAFASDAQLAVAAPRAFIDESRAILLPPQLPPTPTGELAELASHFFPSWARSRAETRSRRALEHWTATEAHDEAMLSGACLFLRRSVIETLDGLFDGRYPLYYEDADLARRLTRAGLRTRLIPEAEILHHWSRSAGSGEVFAGEPARRHAVSRELYLRRFYGRTVERVTRALRGFLERRLARRGPRLMHAFEDLGVLTEAPCLTLSRAENVPQDEVFMEWSVTPNFSLAAGSLPAGSLPAGSLPGSAEHQLSARSWSWLFPGRYFVRALRRSDCAVIGAWTLVKESPARSWPVDHETVAPADDRRRRRVSGEELERWR